VHGGHWGSVASDCEREGTGGCLGEVEGCRKPSKTVSNACVLSSGKREGVSSCGCSKGRGDGRDSSLVGEDSEMVHVRERAAGCGDG
jgi:hypothetical protein